MDQSLIKVDFISQLSLYRMLEDIPYIVSDQMKNDPHAKLGMGTGWSGPKTLWNDNRAWRIKEIITKQLPEKIAFEIEAWANVMTFGTRIGKHNHDDGGRNEISGVLYIAVSNCCPPIIFQTSDYAKTLICIYSGMIVTFPSSLVHEVPIQNCHCSRISVAFNAKRVKLQ